MALEDFAVSTSVRVGGAQVANAAVVVRVAVPVEEGPAPRPGS